MVSAIQARCSSSADHSASSCSPTASSTGSTCNTSRRREPLIMTPDVLRQIMEDFIPFNRYLGVKLAGQRKGFARLEIPYREELVGDPMRPALHGGVLSALADAAG